MPTANALLRAQAVPKAADSEGERKLELHRLAKRVVASALATLRLSDPAKVLCRRSQRCARRAAHSQTETTDFLT